MKLTADGKSVKDVTLELTPEEAHRLIKALLSLVTPDKPADHVHVTSYESKKFYDSPPEITAMLQAQRDEA